MELNNQNQFEKLSVRVADLYQKSPISDGKWSKKSDAMDPWRLSSIDLRAVYSSSLLPLKARKSLWRVFRRIGLDQMWFERFRPYWSQVLGGRPLWSPQDLYFLRNWYRISFQNLGVADDASPQDHTEAWQKPETLYQLLHLVFRESVTDEANILKMFNKHAKKGSKTLVEFGCGTAPITTTFFEFKKSSKLNFHLYDLPTLALHYSAFKFQKMKNVFVHPINTSNRLVPDLPANSDAIFCITVFEHLNEPLEIAKVFHKSLNPGGLLFFDYIKGDADGLDTKQGVEQRKSVLEFFDKNFETLEGQIQFDETTELTVLRKK